jgi:hypothetical protein
MDFLPESCSPVPRIPVYPRAPLACNPLNQPSDPMR